MFLLFQKRFLLLKRCFHVWHLPQVLNCRGHVRHAHSRISSSSCFTMVRCSLVLCVLVALQRGPTTVQWNEQTSRKKGVDFCVLVFLISLIAGTFLNIAGPACRIRWNPVFNQPPPLRNRAVCELWHTRSEAWSQKQQGSNSTQMIAMLSWRASTYDTVSPWSMF